MRETELSAGYVSTLTKRLIGQGYVSDRLGLLYLDDPERLLNDWLAHYRFDRHRKLNFAISAGTYEEGIEKLGALHGSGVSFAWTGWTGAHLRAPYATPTLYMAYVAQEPKKLKDVFPVEKQGNVALYVPQDEARFNSPTSLRRERSCRMHNCISTWAGCRAAPRNRLRPSGTPVSISQGKHDE